MLESSPEVHATRQQAFLWLRSAFKDITTDAACQQVLVRLFGKAASLQTVFHALSKRRHKTRFLRRLHATREEQQTALRRTERRVAKLLNWPTFNEVRFDRYDTILRSDAVRFVTRKLTRKVLKRLGLPPARALSKAQRLARAGRLDKILRWVASATAIRQQLIPLIDEVKAVCAQLNALAPAQRQLQQLCRERDALLVQSQFVTREFAAFSFSGCRFPIITQVHAVTPQLIDDAKLKAEQAMRQFNFDEKPTHLMCAVCARHLPIARFSGAHYACSCVGPTCSECFIAQNM